MTTETDSTKNDSTQHDSTQHDRTQHDSTQNGSTATHDVVRSGQDAADAQAGAAEAASGAATAPTPATAADVEEAMRDVVDPELGINVVDLGLVYGVTVDQHNHAVIDMTLTSAACPLTDVIEDQTTQALEGVVTGYRINWVWMPPWGPDKITPDGSEMLRALGFNV